MRRLTDRTEYRSDDASAMGESYTLVLTMIEAKNIKRCGVTLLLAGVFFSCVPGRLNGAPPNDTTEKWRILVNQVVSHDSQRMSPKSTFVRLKKPTFM